MKFNEWITQNKDEEFQELKSKDYYMYQDDLELIEGQLDQWINKIRGLLLTAPHRKRELLEKVINDLKASIPS